MSKKPLLTHYVSELDQFLQKFDQEHPQYSESQIKEISKHQQIALLRDDPDSEIKTSSTLWDHF